jgi:hypothetical protein
MPEKEWNTYDEPCNAVDCLALVETSVYGGNVTASTIYRDVREGGHRRSAFRLLVVVIGLAVLRLVVVLVVSDCFPDDFSSYLVTLLSRHHPNSS